LGVKRVVKIDARMWQTVPYVDSSDGECTVTDESNYAFAIVQ